MAKPPTSSYVAERLPLETIEDWKTSWDKNKTGWHLDHVNTFLTENIEFLTCCKQNRRILVPFCGKTLDLLWLFEQGHTVIGIEVVQKAVEDFFQDNCVLYEKETVDGYGYCYQAFDGKLKIFNGDYFKFNSALAGGKCDAIWDCNALGALSPNKWKAYLQISREILDNVHGRVLLQAYWYNQDEFSGPPFSVSKEKLGHLLGDSFELLLLNKKLREEKRKRFGVTWLYVSLIGAKTKT